MDKPTITDNEVARINTFIALYADTPHKHELRCMSEYIARARLYIEHQERMLSGQTLPTVAAGAIARGDDHEIIERELGTA